MKRLFAILVISTLFISCGKKNKGDAPPVGPGSAYPLNVNYSSSTCHNSAVSVSGYSEFKDRVSRGIFKCSYYPHGGIVTYRLQKFKVKSGTTWGIFDYSRYSTEGWFYREENTHTSSIIHELGNSYQEVQQAILNILNEADGTSYNSNTGVGSVMRLSSSVFRVRGKDGKYYYDIDLNQPLVANPVQRFHSYAADSYQGYVYKSWTVSY